MEEVSDSPVKCRSCGRLLRRKESIQIGMGPVCFRRAVDEAEAHAPFMVRASPELAALA